MSDLAPAANCPARFTYGDLAPAAVEIAREAAACIRNIQAGFYQEIGPHLLRARAALPHGKFTAWVEAELGINIRSARNYMNAANFIEGKSETISVLPPAVLYALAAPSAAPEVVQAVVTAAAAGQALDAKAISFDLDRARQADAELKAAQRRKPGLTRAQLDADKARRKQRGDAADAKRAADDARLAQEAQDRVRALADAILARPGDVAGGLLAVLDDYRDRGALRALLVAGLREAGQ